MTNTQLTAVADANLTHPRSRKAFQTIRMLTGGYLVLSVLTIAVSALLRNHTALVNSAVWIRGTIVVISAAFTYTFGARAARGSRGAYRRLRIVATVMVAAITVIIALPGTFPLWMKTEQAICGLLLLGVVVVVNGRHLRSAFATA
jgi:hypothetical protein